MYILISVRLAEVGITLLVEQDTLGVFVKYESNDKSFISLKRF